MVKDGENGLLPLAGGGPSLLATGRESTDGQGGDVSRTITPYTGHNDPLLFHIKSEILLSFLH